MDPDVARQAMVEKANEILGLVAMSPSAADSAHEMSTASEELAEAVLSLDEWLRAGGFFPAAWLPINPRRANDGRKQDVNISIPTDPPRRL